MLKIDVEGADTLVLRGAEALLRARRIGTIFFEDNLTRMAKLGIARGEAQALLESCGYRCTPSTPNRPSGAPIWPRSSQCQPASGPSSARVASEKPAGR